MHKKVAVILSGCGVYDGAEIHESVITLLRLSQRGAEAQCFAPNIAQHHVVNHLTGEEMPESRNVLVESARIARGEVKDLREARAEDYDALIVPGGFGAAKNLSDFAINGAQCQVQPDVLALAKAFAEAGKPVGLICIAPAMAAKIYGAGVQCTIGNDADTADALKQMGCRAHRRAGGRDRRRQRAQAGDHPGLHARPVDSRSRFRDQQAGRPGARTGGPGQGLIGQARGRSRRRPFQIRAATPACVSKPSNRDAAMSETPSSALPDDVHQLVADFFQRIPFNRMLGIRVVSLGRERVVLDLPMKDELIGNFVQGILHGGVISSLLDVTGGAMALIGALERHRELPGHERMARLSKLGTIDLRVDYLRPGRGRTFTAHAVPLRSGNKVAVVRSELHSDDGTLVAVGTGTYLCG